MGVCDARGRRTCSRAGRQAGSKKKRQTRRQTDRQKEEEGGRQTGIRHALVRNEEEDEGDGDERQEAVSHED